MDFTSNVRISKSLWKLSDKVGAEERKKEQDARRAKLNKVDGRIGANSRFSNDQIKEMRRLHEVEGKTKEELCEIYGCSNSHMYAVLAYEVRAKYVF